MAQDPLSIRRARSEDRDILADFQVRMARETEGRKLDRQVVREGVQGVLADERRGFYLVAWAEGKVVGSMMITPEWSDWRCGFFWWIQSVYVVPAFRRRGVFSRLYAHAREEGRRAAGVCGLRLYVEKENRAARDTYRALKMIPTSYRIYEFEF